MNHTVLESSHGAQDVSPASVQLAIDINNHLTFVVRDIVLSVCFL